MTINEKVDELLKLRLKIDKAKKAIEPLQKQRDDLQQNIVKAMARQGFDSVRAKTATITKAVRKRLVIKNEDALVSDLKKRGLKDMYKERINSDLWQPFATESIKQKINLAGTEVAETEYISVRQNKNEQKNK